MVKNWKNADWVDPSFNWEPKPVSAEPERVLIDFATKCNLRCPMCTVWGNDDEETIDSVAGLMDQEKASSLIDELNESKPIIQPNMWGEPLLIPNIRERFTAMKENGLTIALNTNGLSLSDSLAEFFIEVGVDSIFFSIDATTKETLQKIRGIDKLEKIEKAVFRMLEKRGDRATPRIGVSFTTQEENKHEENDFIDKWGQIVDCVRVGLVFENGKFPGIEQKGERHACPTLYGTMPIHNDGTVTICCLDGFKDTDVGNVFETSVSDVWQGEAFAKVRYYHETGQWDKVPFCTNCNGWVQYDYQEEIKDDLLIRRSPQLTYYNKIDKLENWHGKLLGGHPEPKKQEE